MSNRAARPVLLVVLMLLALPVPATARSEPSQLASVIVVFRADEVDPAGLAHGLGREHGFVPRHVYTTALKGFAASVPARAVDAIAANPGVLLVERETVEGVSTQSLPTGVDRIEVDGNDAVTTDGSGTGVSLPVAVLDTGIASHSDLNVAGGYSAAGGGWGDGDGHGTHVAGTIAAKDDGSGVVGVAPGAPVWSVRVCKSGRMCLSGDIVAGIDWVAARKADANAGRPGGIDFAAANFSITSSDSANSCASPANATHRAICGVVSHGVVFAMAAGNDARAKVAYPVAFSVAAIADFDGKAGGKGTVTCRSDVDDTLADFSNWGVDIAAPGTCILSTWNDGTYNTISGTSMATPHVSGAIALYLHARGEAPARDALGVSAIESGITASALAQSDPCGYANERGSAERLLFANATNFSQNGVGGDGTCETATTGGGGEEPPATATTFRVSGLQGTSATHGRNAWRATVTTTLSDDLGAPVADGSVSATWTSGGVTLASSTCTTDTTGSCSVTLSRISNTTTSVTFTVDGVTHHSLAYEATDPPPSAAVDKPT